MQYGRFGAFFPIADAQISDIITAGLKADLKKTPDQSDYELAISLPWNLDLNLRLLLTQTLERKNNNVFYKEVLGLVTTT